MKNYFRIFFAAFLILGIHMTQAAYVFKDVGTNTTYRKAIEYLYNNKVVNGYGDNTYRPDNTINRAEFLKILIEAKKDDFESTKKEYQYKCFTDIGEGSWYAPYVCYGKKYHIIDGYPDGTFKPSGNIKLVEALKIVVNVLEVEKGRAGDVWYDIYLNAMGDKGYIPSSLYSLSQLVTRGEMAEMTWRALENLTELDSNSVNEIKNSDCNIVGDNMPYNVNIAKVREEWLKWYNDARQKEGKKPYVYNSQLNRTAVTWSEYSKKRGYMDHKREGQTLYYDYGMISDWFSGLGLSFQNVNGVTFTENIGWGPYSCSDSDCTQSLIDTIYSTFYFFMSEKGSTNTAHYSSLMNDHFNEIGLGIAIGNGKYYLTVHYGTSITSNPQPVCGVE